MSLKQFLKDAKKFGKVLQNELTPEKLLRSASDATIALENSLESIKDFIPKKAYKSLEKAIDFLNGSIEYEGIRMDYGKLVYSLLLIGSGIIKIVVDAMCGNFLCLPADISSLWPTFKETYKTLSQGLKMFSKYTELVVLPKIDALKNKFDHKFVEPIKELIKSHTISHKDKDNEGKHLYEIKITKAQAIENCIKNHTKVLIDAEEQEEDDDDSIIITSSDEDWFNSEFDSTIEESIAALTLHSDPVHSKFHEEVH